MPPERPAQGGVQRVQEEREERRVPPYGERQPAAHRGRDELEAQIEEKLGAIKENRDTRLKELEAMRMQEEEEDDDDDDSDSDDDEEEE